MKIEIRKVGNSCGLILPKTLLEQLQLTDNDSVEARVDQQSLILTRSPATTRAGWAEASLRCADEPLDAATADWLEAPLVADDSTTL